MSPEQSSSHTKAIPVVETPPAKPQNDKTVVLSDASACAVPPEPKANNATKNIANASASAAWGRSILPSSKALGAMWPSR